MSVYTLQIGQGGEDVFQVLEHSGPLGAKNLMEAINKAKRVINSRSWQPESNVVRLLEEYGDDLRVVWERPMIVARDM